jgi:hypothetical protein
MNVFLLCKTVFKITNLFFSLLSMKRAPVVPEW